jgi:asparagine synthase (glutamine-hydrolysing)
VLKLLKLYGSDSSSFHVVRRVRKEKLSYLDTPALLDLHSRVAQLERDRRPGIIIEAGCALGGSAMVITAAKNPSRAFYVYDAFGMIPPPSSRDGRDAHERYAQIATGTSGGIKGDPYYGYEQDLFERVKKTFDAFDYPLDQNNILLVKGLFSDTLLVAEPVALAHLDCDWYDSVMTCLQRIVPHLVRGGALILDDYDDWSGCRAAIDDFFRGRESEFEFVFHSRLHVIRK